MSSSLTKVLAVGAVAAMAFVGAPGAFAADTATAQVAQGSRTVSFADAAGVAPVVSSHTATPVAIPLTLTVDDSSGTRDGWSVTVSASAFVYDGDNGGSNIPASAFSIAPQAVSSAPLGAVTSVGAGGSLGTAVNVLSATESVNGVFIQPVAGTLTVPADSYVGTYTATLTTTFAAAPEAP